MLKEYINSFSLIGNISYIGDIQEQKNGTKYRYFQLAQNNKYKDKDGNLVDEPSFINIKSSLSKINCSDCIFSTTQSLIHL